MERKESVVAIIIKQHKAPPGATIIQFGEVFFGFAFRKLVFMYGLGIGMHKQDVDLLTTEEGKVQSISIKMLFNGRNPRGFTKHKNIMEFVETLEDFKLR